LRIDKSFALGSAILALGVVLLVFTFYLAYIAYSNYRPILPSSSDLSEAITNTTFELLNLVGKIAFLGVMVWASSILLKNGVEAVRAGRAPEEKKKE